MMNRFSLLLKPEHPLPPASQKIRTGVFLLVMVALAMTLPLRMEGDDKAKGFRGDGTGRFPESQPPTKWSKESKNILWKRELGQGYSSPVCYREQIFVTAHPSELYCLDAQTGAEKWKRTISFQLALGKKEADRIAAKHAEFTSRRRELDEKYKSIRKENPDSPKLDEWKQKRKEIDQERKEFERTYPSEKRGGAGNTAATVICHRQQVFVVLGTGIVASCDEKGKLNWVEFLEAPQQGFGHSSSPVIAGKKLIVHINQMFALNLATGETEWKIKTPSRFGSPAVCKLSDAEVIVTPSGTVIDSANGEVLKENLFRLSHNSPLVHNRVVYAHETGKIKAFRLPNSLEEPFEPEPLWESRSTSDQRMATALFHDNLLYAAGRRGIIDVVDAETGKMVYQQRSGLGEIFSSPTLGGGLIYLPGRKGQMLVIQPGRKYQVVSTNELERTSTIPVFDRDRMYLRTDKFLYCIGK